MSAPTWGPSTVPVAVVPSRLQVYIAASLQGLVDQAR